MAWYDKPNSRIQEVKIFRNPETLQRETVLEDFMWFLRCESEKDLSDEQLKDIQSLINEFLGYTFEEVEQGELLLLERWNKSNAIP